MHARDNSEVVMMRVSWSLPTILCLMLGAPALAVAIAGRLSPSETHMFGSLCD